MAVAYTRWLERNGQSREKMATLAVTQRKHTQHNPHAYFYGTPLTREDYFASRMVAYPFCLFDCDIPVQGAVAIVLTTADRARDLKPTPAYLAGYGQRLHFEVAGRIGSLSSYMEGGSSSAKLTWERSGFSPKDVDVAQIYDGFSASVIYGLEFVRVLQGRRGAGFHPGRADRAGWRAAAEHVRRQPRHGTHPRAVAHHRGRAAGVGPRGIAPGEGRQRVVRRGERADRDGDDVYLRAGAVLSSSIAGHGNHHPGSPGRSPINTLPADSNNSAAPRHAAPRRGRREMPVPADARVDRVGARRMEHFVDRADRFVHRVHQRQTACAISRSEGHCPAHNVSHSRPTASNT